MRKYVTEFIGTFFLIVTVGCTAVGHWPGVIAPLAIGSALMVMIFAGGHISGGHYNPAVSLGVWVRGRLSMTDLVGYATAQVLAALLASAVVNYLARGENVLMAKPFAGPALLAEFLFTFALVYVVLNVATADDTRGNSFYGLAIGFTVLAGAFAVGPISSAAFNPSVALSLCILGILPWHSIWIYLLANLAGGAIAGVVFKYVAGETMPARPTLRAVE